MKQAFLFVLSNVEIQAPLPMELVPGITLQRATQEQVRTIKEKLHVFGPSSLKEDIYEARWFKAENGTMRFEKLPADFWRYWIVPRTEGDRERLVDLKTVCALLPTELVFGFTITRTGGLGWDTGVSVAFAKPSLMFPIGPPTAFLEPDLKQISATYYLLETAKKDFSSIHRAARLFYDLRLIP